VHESGSGPWLCSRAVTPLVRPREKANARYLLWFLRQRWIRREGELRMTGSGGQRRVPEAYLRDFRIPLPSLDEQKRVAVILDQVDALRAKRREAIALLDDLAQSIFLDIFGDRIIRCDAGSVIALSSVTDKIASRIDSRPSITISTRPRPMPSPLCGGHPYRNVFSPEP
jgi:restriction endonuclease S subunit